MNRPYIVRRAKRDFSVDIEGKAYRLPKKFRDTTHELKIFQDGQGFYLVSSCKEKHYLSLIHGSCKAADLQSCGFIGYGVKSRQEI